MLEICELTKQYGSFLALDHLSLSIGQGELHGFVGPNGAGKTTTMRILATLQLPTSGSATLEGVEVTQNPKEIRRLMGYMPDFFGVYDRLKAWEYLDFYARCYGFGYKERMRMIESLLELVHLFEKRDSYVDVLSRGMKQRLCLARALIHDPKLLILDEPASGMDPRARAEMKGILKTLKELGKTVLISSHILPELSELCDSLTIIDHGKLVFSGTVEALSSHMSGEAPVTIRLGGEMNEELEKRAVSMLKQYPGVTKVIREEAGLFQTSFDGGDDAMVGLLKAAAQALPVADFHRAPLNLEKVFMEVTQND
ncbi:MAG: ABC transporter ATP-binding protein [Eubacteriales bacterium]|nr:ABC transporter ATP-binding protein [Eubacteriales bacterium]